VLHFEVNATGWATALPYVLSALLKVLAGPFSDHMACVGDKARVILFATVSQAGVAICFIGLSLCPTDGRLLAQIFFTAATAFSGINCVGVVKSAQMMSRQYSYVLHSVNMLENGIVTLVLPLVVALIASGNTAQEWNRIFWGIAAIVVVTILFFDFTAEVEPRWWTYQASKNVSSKVPIENDAATDQTKDDEPKPKCCEAA
ncbi:Protein F41C3.2, partial [Aphelenchoides avenae]